MSLERQIIRSLVQATVPVVKPMELRAAVTEARAYLEQPIPVYATRIIRFVPPAQAGAPWTFVFEPALVAGNPNIVRVVVPVPAAVVEPVDPEPTLGQVLG